MSKFDLKPALTFLDNSQVTKYPANDTHEQIKSRYYRGKIIEDDDIKSILGLSTTIVNDCEH